MNNCLYEQAVQSFVVQDWVCVLKILEGRPGRPWKWPGANTAVLLIIKNVV